MPITTSVFLRKDNKILLALKKRGFGTGKYMGVGGKMEDGESLEETAIREVQEEIGVKVTKIQRLATVIFDDLYYNGAPERTPMYVFVATEWDGEPTESDEVRPEWYTLADIPYEKMWSDAEVYLPHVLRGEKIEAYFRYNEKNEWVEHWVKPVPQRIIARLDDKSVGLSAHEPVRPHISRVTARAILLDEHDKIIYTKVGKEFYVSPGGGVDDGELLTVALRREVREEVGYEVEIICPLGQVIEEQHWGNKYQANFYYLCRAKEFVGAAMMPDEEEKDLRTVVFNSFDEAIQAVRSSHSKYISEYSAPFFIERDTAALREAERVLKMRKLGHNLRGRYE